VYTYRCKNSSYWLLDYIILADTRLTNNTYFHIPFIKSISHEYHNLFSSLTVVCVYRRKVCTIAVKSINSDNYYSYTNSIVFTSDIRYSAVVSIKYSYMYMHCNYLSIQYRSSQRIFYGNYRDTLQCCIFSDMHTIKKVSSGRMSAIPHHRIN
jgi:hypothetical protein